MINAGATSVIRYRPHRRITNLLAELDGI